MDLFPIRSEVARERCPTDKDATTPDTVFRWDPTAQQWIFNTATGTGTTLNTKGVTYLFNIVLIDGTIIGSSGTGGLIPSAPFAGQKGYQYGLK